jgi:hypothetical protein
MAEELIESYVDRSKISKDTDFLIGELNKALDVAKQFKTIEIKINGSSSYKDISNGAEEAVKANGKLSDSVKILNEVNKQREASENKLKILQSDTTKDTIANRVEIQKRNQELKAQAQFEAANEGSINKARAAVKLLTIERDNLTLKTGDNSAKQAELNTKINEYNTFIKENVDALAQQKINIGNYEGSAKIIVDALEKQQVKLQTLTGSYQKFSQEVEKSKNIITGFGSASTNFSANKPNTSTSSTPGNTTILNTDGVNKSTEEIKKLEEEITKTRTVIEGFTRITEQPNFLNIASKVGDAQAEVRFFTKSLIDLEAQGLGNSEAANALRERLAKLSDQIKDTKEQVKALSSDTRGFDLFASSVTFAANAFQTFAGVAALAGKNEKDTAETIKTLVAVQSIANGVKGIATELTKEGTAANKLYAFAQNQVTIALDTTVAATARLKAALTTIGIGALIIAIGYLIANFSKVKEALGLTNKAQEDYNKSIEESKIAIEGAVKSNLEVKNAIDQVKAGLLSEKQGLEIVNSSWKDLGITFKSTAEAEKVYLQNAPKFIEIQALKAKANYFLGESAKLAAESFTAGDLAKPSAFNQLKANTLDLLGFSSAARNLEIRSQIENAEKLKKIKADDSKRLELEAKKFGETAAQIAKSLIIPIPTKKGFIEDLELKIANLNEKLPGATKQGATKIKAEIQKLQDELSSIEVKKISASDINKEIKSIEEKLNKEIELEKLKNKSINEINIENSNEQIRINQLIVNAETSTIDQRIKALQTIGEEQKKIAIIEFTEAIQNEKEVQKQKGIVQIIEVQKTKEQILLAETIYNNKIKNINDTFLDKKLTAEKDNTEKIRIDKEKLINDQQTALELEKSVNDRINEQKYSNEIKSLNSLLEKKVISQKEYDKKRENLDKEYQKNSIQNEINFQRDLIEISDLPIKAKEEALAKLAAIEKKYSDLSIENIKKNEDEKLKKIEGTFNTIKEISDKVFNVINGVLNANLINTKNALRAEQDGAENKAAKDIEIVNKSIISEEEKAAKITVINARLAAQKDQIAQKERNAELQKARFDKAQAIFSIIINTAQAVIKFLASANIPGAILAGVYGAAQLAIVTSTPIPQYKKGKNIYDNYEGLAIVGDGGKAEVIQRSNGNIELTPAVDTLTHIGKNDIIYPNKEAWLQTFVNAANKDSQPLKIPLKNNADIFLIKTLSQQNRLLTQIANKKELHLGAGDKGMIALWKWGAIQTKYIDQNCNF